MNFYRFCFKLFCQTTIIGGVCLSNSAYKHLSNRPGKCGCCQKVKSPRPLVCCRRPQAILQQPHSHLLNERDDQRRLELGDVIPSQRDGTTCNTINCRIWYLPTYLILNVKILTKIPFCFWVQTKLTRCHETYAPSFGPRTVSGCVTNSVK